MKKSWIAILSLVMTLMFLVLADCDGGNVTTDTPADVDNWPVAATKIFGPNVSDTSAGSVTLLAVGTYQVLVTHPATHYSIQLSAPSRGAESGITLPPGDYAITGSIHVAQSSQAQTVIGEVVPWGTWTPSVIWAPFKVPTNGATIPIRVAFTVQKNAQYQLSLHFGSADLNAKFDISNIVLRSRNGFTVQVPDNGHLAPISVIGRPTDTHVVPWLQAFSTTGNGTAEFRKPELWIESTNGTKRLAIDDVTFQHYGNQSNGWGDSYYPACNGPIGPTTPTNEQFGFTGWEFTNAVAKVTVNKSWINYYYDLWNYERFPISTGEKVVGSVEVRITGDLKVRMGADLYGTDYIKGIYTKYNEGFYTNWVDSSLTGLQLTSDGFGIINYPR